MHVLYIVGPFLTGLFAGFASTLIITGNLKSALKAGFISGSIAFIGDKIFPPSSPAQNAGAASAAGGTGDVIVETASAAANPTVGATTATNIASGGALVSAGNQAATSVGTSIAGTAAKDAVVKLANVVVTGTPISISQIIAEAILYQSLTQITRDMIEASFEGYAIDTDFQTVNAFRLSSNALQEAYAIVAKEIGLRQFQTAFLINTINVVSLVSGVGGVAINVAKGIAGKLFTTTVFRVEGIANQRVFIDAVGNVTLKGNNTLFLNFGNAARAKEFLAQRLGQGFLDTTIKTFKVPNSFVKDLVKSQIPETLARKFPSLPFLVDTTKAALQFGLREPQIVALQRSIIRGSGL